MLFLFGVTLISLGLAFVLVDVYRNTDLASATYYLTLQFLPRLERALIVGTLGIAALSIAVYKLSRSILSPFTRPGGKPVAQALVEHRQRERGPKVVAIGGGTGLSTLLRGLKHYTSNITAIVTVADDGGSSGRLRRELGVLPPGDFRNCLAALADDESLTTQLFQYRFAPTPKRSGRARAGQSVHHRHGRDLRIVRTSLDREQPRAGDYGPHLAQHLE